MPSIIPNGSRRYVAIAFVAAALGIGASLPARAEASRPEQNAALGCDPSFEYCEWKYTYYTSSAKTTVTGHATRDCDGFYTLDDGYATSYYTIRYFYCPI